MSESLSFYLIRTESAPKASLRAGGNIRYAVLRDELASDVFFCLLANDSGGYFSQEAVPFTAVAQCVKDLSADRPIPAKTFKGAFRGRSVNNPGFLVAALRQEGLLLPAPDASHQHVLGSDWSAWRQRQLLEAGEPFELPDVVKAKARAAAEAAISNPVETSPAKAKTKRKGKQEAETGTSNADPT